MKKLIMGFAACALMITSCQKSEVADNIEQNSRSLSFNLVMGTQTRAAELMTDDLKATGKPIDLWAYNNPLSGSGSPYFKEILEYNRSGSATGWSTEYQRFVPTSGTLDYYAVYPAGSAANWSNPTPESLAQFEYSVTGEGDKIDLVAAAVRSQSTQSPTLPMRHILSQINFGVYGYKGAQIAVSNFQVHNVKQTGVYTFADNSVGSWSGQSSSADYGYKMHGASVPLRPTDVQSVTTGELYIFGDGGNSAVGTSAGIYYNTAPDKWDAASNISRAKLSNSLMLLPQTLKESYFTFDYTVRDKDGNDILIPATGTVDLSVNGTIRWEPNRRYVYMIDFKDILDAKALDFSVSVLVESWENYNKDDYNFKDDGIVDLSPFWRFDHTVVGDVDSKTITYFTAIPGDPTPNGTVLDVTANEANELTIVEGANTSSFNATTLNLTAPVIPAAGRYAIKAIGINAFKDNATLVSITLPEGLTSIGLASFFGCTSLEFINLPSSVKSIGRSAFEVCESLESIVIPEGVTAIENLTFHKCYKLEDIKLPSTLQRIGDNSFRFCEALWEIVIPENVTAIGEKAFERAISLRSAVLPAGLKTLGSSAFNTCRSLESVNIPETITVLNEYTFNACSKLKSVKIPSGVTTLSMGAFWFCSALEKVEISPASALSTIGDIAFASCSKLTSIVIPAGVTSIGTEAFKGCQTLASIYCYVPTQSNITIRTSAFDNKQVTRILYVPIGCTSNFYPSTWNANGVTVIMP